MQQFIFKQVVVNLFTDTHTKIGHIACVDLRTDIKTRYRI